MNDKISGQPEKMDFFSLRQIKSKGADYNIIFGERSNGKTYAVLEEIVTRYIKSGKKEQGGIIRRWAEDFRGKRGVSMFTCLESNAYGENVIEKLTKGEWTTVKYWSGRWYLAKWDEVLQKEVMYTEPMCYAFSIASQEHDKSISYPGITTLLFDEMLTRGKYIPDEFVSFMNIVSTVVRTRDNVKIYMLGNTVSKFSPYFNEMGLKHIAQMNPGDIDIYTYGESGLKVAVQYADIMGKKASNKYFAFDNPKLNMITGGVWEMAMYPHLPYKYTPQNVLFQFFIIFDENILHCEIIYVEKCMFLYIHRKTTPIQDENKDIVYTTEFSPKYNYRRKLTKPIDDIDRRICNFFAMDKVFYQDNEIGEIMRNYLMWCNTKDFK